MTLRWTRQIQRPASDDSSDDITHSSGSETDAKRGVAYRDTTERDSADAPTATDRSMPSDDPRA